MLLKFVVEEKKIPKMSNISTDHDHHNYENDFAFLKSKFIIHCDE